MSEQFYTIPTAIGKAKIANSIALGTKINLTTMKIGDSNGAYYEPNESQTDIVHTVYTCNITSVAVDENNSNWINIICAISSDVGDFYIREAGAYDDTGALIAIGKYPVTYKPIAANGSTKELYIKMTLEVTNSSSVELKIDPTVILATKKDINTLTTSVNSIKSEVENSRGTYENLEARLDYGDSQLSEIVQQIINIADNETISELEDKMSSLETQLGIIPIDGGTFFENYIDWSNDGGTF